MAGRRQFQEDERLDLPRQVQDVLVDTENQKGKEYVGNAPAGRTCPARSTTVPSFRFFRGQPVNGVFGDAAVLLSVSVTTGMFTVMVLPLPGSLAT